MSRLRHSPPSPPASQVHQKPDRTRAILTRVASSHLRVGTVQYFAMTRGGDVATLVDYVVDRHFSTAAEAVINLPP